MADTWDGVERRNTVRYCDGHLEFSNALTRIEERLKAVDLRINGSIDDIEKHIEHGYKWRMSIIGCFLTVVLGIISAVFGYGQITRQVEVNTREVIEINNNIDRQLEQMRIEIRNPQVYKK